MARLDFLYMEISSIDFPSSSTSGIGFIHDNIPVFFEEIHDESENEFLDNTNEKIYTYSDDFPKIKLGQRITKYIFDEITSETLNRYTNILCGKILDLSNFSPDNECKIDPKFQDFLESHLRENKIICPINVEFVPNGITGEIYYKDIYSFFTGDKTLPYIENNFWKHGLDKFVSLIKTQS